MLFGDNVCTMGIIRAKDNVIYAFRDNSSLSTGIIWVYRDISSLHMRQSRTFAYIQYAKFFA